MSNSTLAALKVRPTPVIDEPPVQIYAGQRSSGRRAGIDFPYEFVDVSVYQVGGYRLTGYATRVHHGSPVGEPIMFDVSVPIATEPCVRALICSRLDWGSALITDMQLADTPF